MRGAFLALFKVVVSSRCWGVGLPGCMMMNYTGVLDKKVFFPRLFRHLGRILIADLDSDDEIT